MIYDLNVKITKMLFSEYQYLDYKFPEPQYLGAKYIHRAWISQFIPQDIMHK